MLLEFTRIEDATYTLLNNPNAISAPLGLSTNYYIGGFALSAAETTRFANLADQLHKLGLEHGFHNDRADNLRAGTILSGLGGLLLGNALGVLGIVMSGTSILSEQKNIGSFLQKLGKTSRT